MGSTKPFSSAPSLPYLTKNAERGDIIMDGTATELDVQREACLELQRLQGELCDALRSKGEQNYPPIMRSRGTEVRAFLEGERGITSGTLFEAIVAYTDKPTVGRRITALRDVLKKDGMRSASLYPEASIRLAFDLHAYIRRHFDELPFEPVVRALATQNGQRNAALQSAMEAILGWSSDGLAALADKAIADALTSSMKEDVRSLQARLTPTDEWQTASAEFERLHAELRKQPKYKELQAIARDLGVWRGTVTRALSVKSVEKDMPSLDTLHELIDKARELLGLPKWEQASVAATAPASEDEAPPPASSGVHTKEDRQDPGSPPEDKLSGASVDELLAMMRTLLGKVGNIEEELRARQATVPTDVAAAPLDPDAISALEMMLMSAVVTVRGLAQLRRKLGHALGESAQTKIIDMLYDLVLAGDINAATLDRIMRGPSAQERREGLRVLAAMLGETNGDTRKGGRR